MLDAVHERRYQDRLNRYMRDLLIVYGQKWWNHLDKRRFTG